MVQEILISVSWYFVTYYKLEVILICFEDNNSLLTWINNYVCITNIKIFLFSVGFTLSFL